MLLTQQDPHPARKGPQLKMAGRWKSLK